MTMNALIKSRRLALGLSQTQLAHAVSELEGLARPLTYATVQQWESGATAPKHKRIQHVAEALQTTVPELLGDTKAQASSNTAAWPFRGISAEQFDRLPQATREHIESLVCSAAGLPSPLDWRHTARSLAAAVDRQLHTDHHTHFVISLEQHFDTLSAAAKGSNSPPPARQHAKTKAKT